VLGFALHGRCIHVVHFNLIGRAAGKVGGVLALRDNTFEAELAGMGENGRAVAFDMLVESMPGRALATIDASVALRTSSGSRRRSSPFNSMRSKA